MSRDRRIILERRRRFLAAALATAGVAGVAQGCADKQTQPQVCLSQPYDDRPQVCLEPMIEEDAGPPPQPCLSPVPNDDPEPQVCLSVEAPPDDDFAQPPPDDEG